MRNLFATILCITACTCYFSAAIAQDEIKGKVVNYHAPAADVLTGFQNPIIVGSVSEHGDILISLPEDFAKTMADKSSKQENSNFSIRLMSVQEAFGNCDNGKVEVENGEQSIYKLSTQNSLMIADLKNKENYGYIIPGSDEEFAEKIMAYGQKGAKLGYLIDWFYFEEPASVKGSCKVKTYTLTQKEEDVFEKETNYALNFENGWNIVLYEYNKINTDSEGNQAPEKITYKTIKKIPGDLNFYYFSE